MPAISSGRIINGNAYDFSSITITIANIPYQGVTEISYNESLEPGELRGTGAYMRARTRGEYKAESSFSMGKADFEPLLQALRKTPTGGYAEKPFLITVVYAEAGSPTITDMIEGCRITKIEDSHGGKSDALVVKVDLNVFRICRNGSYMVAENVAAAAGLVAP